MYDKSKWNIQKMKLKDLGTFSINSKTKQNMFFFRVKKMRKMRMTPEQLAELVVIKPQPFIKKKK